MSLAGCASAPPTSGSIAPVTGIVVRPGPAPASERDGPEANPPSGLASTPDAEPRIEPVRAGGPNKPYDALGKTYVPIIDDRPYVERGLASWYGKKFQGRRTSSGEPYDMYAMTAAHPTLPIPSYARVRNPSNGSEVVVRINDRGPFHSTRIVDLSYTAALKLGVLRGVTPVELERITPEDIRTGAWQRGASGAALAQRDAADSIAAQTTPQRAVAPKAAVATAAAKATAATASAAARSSMAAITATAATAAAAATAVAVADPSAATPATAGPIATSGTAALSALPPLPVAETTGLAAATQAQSPSVPAQSADTPAARGFWVQIGAFRERSGAETFQRRVASEFDWLAPLLAIFDDQTLHRLQAGPYSNRGEAGSASQRISEALQLKPVIVERR